MVNTGSGNVKKELIIIKRGKDEFIFLIQKLGPQSKKFLINCVLGLDCSIVGECLP